MNVPVPGGIVMVSVTILESQALEATLVPRGMELSGTGHPYVLQMLTKCLR